MRKNKIFLIVCVSLCVVLTGVVLAVAFWKDPLHKHKLGDARVYHVYGDHAYYTRQCNKDDHAQRYNINASFVDLVSTIRSIDKIILEEDVVVNSEISIRSYMTAGTTPKPTNVKVDIDLNGYQLSTNNVLTKQTNSLFMLDATLGSIEFNVKNGSVNSQDLSYIFNFKTRDGSVKLNINNVQCEVTGVKTTPIYASGKNISVNASDSDFISRTTTTERNDFGVGVFINSNDQFNFTDCYFEGGDAVYVSKGKVNLTDCILQNKGLMAGTIQVVKQSESFVAIGSCLAAESYTANGATSKFEITINSCKMYTTHNNIGNTNRVMYVFKTSNSESLASINADSYINIESCIFDQNPSGWEYFDIVNYPNDIVPEDAQDGFWICGDVE